jgi:hypothetical protein
MKTKIVHLSIIGIFCSLYFLVATISMINSVEFFDLAHSGLMSWSLALGFELGAAASLAAIVILEKTNRAMVWALFLLLTGFQMMANSYHAFVNLEDYMGWIELFGLQEEEVLFQKRILSVISGAVLPVVALGFIKSLIDYIRPSKLNPEVEIPEQHFYQREAPTPMKVTQQPITEQSHPSEDLVERVKENQAKLTEDPEVYEDYDSEGNIIIPPRIVEKSIDAIQEIKKATKDTHVPYTPSKPKDKVGRKIIGKKQRTNISSKPRI